MTISAIIANSDAILYCASDSTRNRFALTASSSTQPAIAVAASKITCSATAYTASAHTR